MFILFLICNIQTIQTQPGATHAKLENGAPTSTVRSSRREKTSALQNALTRTTNLRLVKVLHCRESGWDLEGKSFLVALHLLHFATFSCYISWCVVIEKLPRKGLSSDTSTGKKPLKHNLFVHRVHMNMPAASRHHHAEINTSSVGHNSFTMSCA